MSNPLMSEQKELAVDFAALESAADNLAGAALAVARRFAAGATMWCASPRWPSHGRHVAVEFVHPVIVGKRALPALYVDDSDLVGTMRLLVRPGDVVLALGTADEPELNELLRRSDPWGLTSVWIGAGPRPASGMVDHLLWVESADPGLAGRSSGFVMLYHLLWELTHVVFEHPGLLETPIETCTDEVCITCSDEGRVAEVTTVDDDGGAVALVAGQREPVDTTLVGPRQPGDLVLVHAGIAITVIDEARP